MPQYTSFLVYESRYLVLFMQGKGTSFPAKTYNLNMHAKHARLMVMILLLRLAPPAHAPRTHRLFARSELLASSIVSACSLTCSIKRSTSRPRLCSLELQWRACSRDCSLMAAVSERTSLMCTLQGRTWRTVGRCSGRRRWGCYCAR